MATRVPEATDVPAEHLVRLGQQIRAHRKALRINATAVAEAAGISRVTLFRIEKGEPTVTMGAWLKVMAALGIEFGIIPPKPAANAGDVTEGWIPARVHLSDYPQLRQLAWQVQGTDELTPVEALSIYERNERHLDMADMTPQERHLIEALRLALGTNRKKGGKDV